MFTDVYNTQLELVYLIRINVLMYQTLRVD